MTHNDRSKKIVIALSLILGLAFASNAHAASPKAKPSISKAKEGSASHEMSEAATGTGEEGSTKITKAKKSVIKKKVSKKASPSPTK